MRDYDADYFITTEAHEGLDAFAEDPELRLLHRANGGTFQEQL